NVAIRMLAGTHPIHRPDFAFTAECVFLLFLLPDSATYSLSCPGFEEVQRCLSLQGIRCPLTPSTTAGTAHSNAPAGTPAASKDRDNGTARADDVGKGKKKGLKKSKKDKKASTNPADKK